MQRPEQAMITCNNDSFCAFCTNSGEAQHLVDWVYLTNSLQVAFMAALP